MKAALGFLIALLLYGPVSAQDLPPDILADMYLLEATKALEDGEAQEAIRAFGKIEALDTEPPPEFAYFYGKLLVENGATFNDLLKGQRLLKSYVLRVEKDSEHYTQTLELLSDASRKLRRIEKNEKKKGEARRAKARIDTTILKFSAEAERSDTPLLHYAVLRDARDIVPELVARGEDVNAVDKHGETPLMSAAAKNHIEMVSLLIEHGSNVNATTRYGRTALSVAASKNALGAAKLLIDRGAKVNPSGTVYHDGWTPLHSAARRLSYEVAELLIARGARVNAHSRNVQRPLCEAYTGGTNRADLSAETEVQLRRQTAALLRRHGGTCKNSSICEKHKC